MCFLYKIKAWGYGVLGADMEKRKTKFKAKKQPLRTTNGNILNLLRQIYTLTKQGEKEAEYQLVDKHHLRF
jgi:hypothetical protein